MKQKLLNTMAGVWLRILTLVALVLTIGTSASADYTCQFGSSYNSGGISAYDQSWTVTVDNFIWDIANFNNSNNAWEYVKCGSKKFTSVATITTQKAIPEQVSDVVVTIDAITASSVNGISLSTSTTNDFTNPIETVTISKAKGDQTATLTKPAENLYYKLSFDCQKASSNGIVQISKVVYKTVVSKDLGAIKCNDEEVADGSGFTAVNGDKFTFTAANATGMSLSVKDSTDPAVEGAESVEWTAPKVTEVTNYELTVTATDGTNTNLVTVTVTVSPAPGCGAVVFDPASGEIVKGSFVTITCENAKQIKYWFGEDVDTAQTVDIDDAKVAINEACTLHALGINADGIEGATNDATYTVKTVTNATFDFLNEDLIKGGCDGISPSGSSSDLIGKTIKLNGVTLTFGNEGSNPPRWWTDKYLRLYDKNILTISAPDNCFITKITVTGALTATSNPAGYNNQVWTPASSESSDTMREVASGVKTVVLTKSGNRQEISKIEVDFNTSTGIVGIAAESGEAVYYNLQGVRVDNPVKGLYIRVANGKSSKVVL